LEIGVNQGDTFNNVSASIKVAVDPHFISDQLNRIDNGQFIRFFPLTSDQYFGNIAHEQIPFDVIFIDGLHTFEQVFRDLLNSIARLNPKGVIIIDDVIPTSYRASLPDLTLVSTLGNHLGSQDASWMGDVYKLVFLLQSSFQQFSYATIQENHGQLVLWHQRRPASSLISRKIEQISRLEYCDVIQHDEVFNIRPCAEIVAAVKTNIGWHEPTRGLPGRSSAKTPADIPEASAFQECVKTAAWTEFFGLYNGCKTIADGIQYVPTKFICENKDTLTPNCLKTLSVFEQRTVINVAKITLYAFEDVTVLPVGALLANGKLISETLAPRNSIFRSQVEKYLCGVDRFYPHSVHQPEIDRPVLMIEQPGLFNYGHWLVEMFPKVFPALEQIICGKLGICLPAHYRESKIITQTLLHAGVTTNNIEWINIFERQDKLTTLERVLYVSPISMHWEFGYISPWIADVLNRLTSNVPTGSQKKIFVSRKDAQARYLLNEDDVYATIQPLGYVLVRTAEMSFPEQVLVFKGASEIIGVYGASLSNMIFCEPGTKVLNICPNTYVDHFYWDIASVRQINYWHFSGIVDDSLENFNSDFRVEMESFLRVLEKFTSA
jgi:capsular polysaccharide biosynthesis protein